MISSRKRMLIFILILSVCFSTALICNAESQPSASGVSVIGDLNGDGAIDVIDYSLMKKVLLGSIADLPVKDDIQAADLDGDGKITALDFSLLKQYLLGIITKFPKVPVVSTTRKIMPLGDSITDGFNVPGGYRIKLWKDITDNGYKVDFVGSSSNGPAELGDRDHEGHTGWHIDQLDANINAWMDSAKPEIVMLQIGTNDILHNYDMTTAPSRLNSLIEKICAKLPDGGKLYVAKITPLGKDYPYQKVSSYNNQVAELVANKAKQGKPVYLVDMYSVLTADDLADGIHPGRSGYDKMADAWYNAIHGDLGK